MLLGQCLKELGFCHEGMIQEALATQQESGKRIGETLLALGHIDGEQLAQGLAKQAGLGFVASTDLKPTSEALAKIDSASARVYAVLPLRVEGGVLFAALSDPLNAGMIEDLSVTTGLEFDLAVAEAGALAEAIESSYANDSAAGRDALDDAVSEFTAVGSKGIDLEDKAAMASAAPVVKLLNFILYQAVRDKASDIHLEPFEDDFKIRYRVDGVLYELKAPPPHLAVALISRVKVMAELDIAETRIPQDGRIELSVGGRPIDLRISTLPTMFGESCVMRVLDRSVVSLDLDNIGLRQDEHAVFERLLGLPHGIALVTGPTGSGKTTTLYAMLNAANQDDVKIITTEDPVEYDLEGIVQIPVNDEIGVTYARVLRTILRQDPDKILVGEIRDEETARVAIEASLTGHVVFSTLHTNDAPSAITRMLDIGVEPYLLTATLEVIVAQRLVRKVCVDCKAQYVPDDKVVLELGIDRDAIAGKSFFYGKGCDSCNHTGFRGRVAIFEIMQVTEDIKHLVLDGAPTAALRRQARADGMRSLRESGLLAIYDGWTSVEEVLRETM
ncbi:MAG: Flp pilus assembly complex ATPase component TadA [Planctomycetes bacterium]|nr:Flp pilus assembly complex ATPase component TadA [Planctomycetota bacterium]